MRTYTVQTVDSREVYKGFNKQIDLNTKLFALTMIDGQPEIWALDSPKYVSELERYYKDMGYDYLYFRVLTKLETKHVH